MTIDQCIDEYLRFSKDVLTKQRPLSDDNLDLHVVDSAVVEKFVHQILRVRRESNDRLLQAPSALSCKV